MAEVRRCKHRRLAWLRYTEVAWWDAKVPIREMLWGTFSELRNRGSSLSLGDCGGSGPQVERDAWAEHFRLIGEGPVGLEYTSSGRRGATGVVKKSAIKAQKKRICWIC